MLYNPADPETPLQRDGQSGIRFSGNHAKRSGMRTFVYLVVYIYTFIHVYMYVVVQYTTVGN
jgi:hypothetical protein